MATATVTSKRLRLVAGSKIDFVQNAAGETVVRAKTGDIRELRGFFKYDGPPVSLEDMDRGIAEAVVERYKRSLE
jgi:FAD/FMN-containing dehydrogenase